MVSGVTVAVLVLAAMAYHFLIGYVESAQIDDRITVLTRKNILGPIGGNVIVYGDTKGTVVVDTQLPPFASSTRTNVDAVAHAPIAAVLVTHWHPDHSGGITAFSGGSEVIAHENVLRRLSAPQEGYGLTKPGSHHEFEARKDSGLPNKTVSNRLDIATGASEINVVHYPNAHTDGDLVVFFHDAQLVAIGDLIWPGSFPYIDVHNGGTVTGLESALQGLLAESKPGYRFIPGHGKTLLGFENVGEYLKVVSETRQWVETQFGEGQTVAQVVATGLPEKWETWSSPLVPSRVWIEMVLDSLQKPVQYRIDH